MQHRSPAHLLKAFAVMLAVVGCSSPRGEGVPDAAGPGVDDAGVADAGVRCLAPVGDSTHVILVGQVKRTVLVHAPGSDGGLRPAVLAFHGAGHTADDMRRDTRLDAVADREGFVAVYPLGTEWTDGGHAGATWNIGGCCGPASDLGVDDVAFTRELIDALLVRELCVDPQRVYATGMSNGAFLSHRLACDLADRISGIAAVAGTITAGACTPSRPVRVLQVHGTDDPAVPYDGGGVVSGALSVPATVAGWLQRNGCTGGPAEVYRKGDAHCSRWTGCAEVELCTIEGGGHAWPGGAGVQGGQGSPNLDTSQRLADFLLRR